MKPPDTGVGLAISLAITFLSGLLGFQINITENSHEIKKKIEETKNEFIEKQRDQLRSRVKIVELTGKEIESLIMERIKGADLVRNTYVNLAEKMSRIPKAEESAIQQYADFLSIDEKHWIDITTIQDMNLGRYDKINISKVGVGSRHDVSIINSSTDIINFLLIDKDNAPSDLFFGWVGGGVDYFRAFWTNDRAMLEVFSNYFASLQAASLERIQVDYSGGRRRLAKADALLGRWVCVPQIRATKPSAYHTYSILDVSLFGGIWKVRSEVFLAKSSRRIRVIESEVAISHAESIFFEGISRSVGGTQRSVTFGQFKLAPDYDDMLIGTYVAEDAKTINRLFACRFDGDFEDNSFDAVVTVIEKIVGRRDILKADDWDLEKTKAEEAAPNEGGS